MTQKKPWCAEAQCRPQVPMHTKGCQRRAEFLAKLNREMDVVDLPAEPGSNHYSHWMPEDLTQEQLDEMYAAVQRSEMVIIPVPDPFMKELLAYQKERLDDARRNPGGTARAEVPIMIEDPERKVDALRAASLAKLKEHERPALPTSPQPKKPTSWWRRVLSRG